MYLGSDDNGIQAHYYIPLLARWENNPTPANEQKLEMAKKVAKVELITNTASYDFPIECKPHFSRGEFKAIYQTLKDGSTCFCIRDIKDNKTDEEARETPFNFLFIANGKESIKKLDNLALSYLEDSNKVEEIIRNSISYDPQTNGIKFDLPRMEEELPANNAEQKIFHINGKVIYLKLNNSSIEKALTALNIDNTSVDAFYDYNNNIIRGAIRFEDNNIPPIIYVPKSKEGNTNDNPENQDSGHSSSTESSSPADVQCAKEVETEESSIDDNTPKVSIADETERPTQGISSEDLEAIKMKLKEISEDINEKYTLLTALINESKRENDQLIQIRSAKDVINIIKSLTDKEIIIVSIIMIIGMIVGIIFGALIF